MRGAEGEPQPGVPTYNPVSSLLFVPGNMNGTTAGVTASAAGDQLWTVTCDL